MLEIGSLFGPYRLEGILGRGGMGMVFEATQLSLNRVVALKVVAPGLSADTGFRERFRREGPMQARIDHPHIVPVYEAGEHDGHLFIAMRLVRGSTLKALVVSRELDPRRSLRLLADVGDALDTAHEAGLIHRDVKPSNVLVGRRDQAFLCDFGLTKEPGSGSGSLTKTGHVVGTLDYIAPEQIRGEEATSASDVYAFAAVLYETLTGQVPFPRSTDAALLYAHVSDPPPKVTDLRPDLPAALDEVVARGMAKLPTDRPSSPLELVAAAEAALGATRPPAPILPLDPRAGEPTVADTPPAAVVAPPGSTVGDPGREQESTVADELPAAATPTLTDAGAQAARAASTLTDAARPAEPVAAAPEPAPAEPASPEPAPPAPPAPAPPEPVAAPADPQPSPARRTATAPTRPLAPEQEPVAARRTATSPTRPLEPAPPPARARRSSGRPVALAAAAVAALAGGALAGALAGEPESVAPVAPRAVSAGVATVDAPPDWRRRPEPSPILGLAWADSVTLAAADGELVVGRLPDAGGRLLLGDTFVKSLDEEPDPAPVRLRPPLEAYLYAGLDVPDEDRPLDLHVVPTSQAVLGVACLSSDEGFMARCAGAAKSLRLDGAQAYPLGPDDAYGRRLADAFEGLGAPRVRLEAKLEAARTRRGQARAATQLRDAYATARGRLGQVPANPTMREAAGSLADAVTGLARAYEQLASAARAGAAARYRAAAAAVAVQDERLRRALRGLEDAGYDVRGR